MTNTIQLSRNIKVSTHHIHKGETLFTDCKVNTDLLLFSKVNNNSLDSLYAQDESRIDHSTLKSRQYLLNICMDNSTERLGIGMSPQDFINLPSEMAMNRSIRSQYAYFDKVDQDNPIRFATFMPVFVINLAKPDDLRRKLKALLPKIGVTKAIIYGLDFGHNGKAHFHVLFQGYLKDKKAVLKRYAWGYHVWPEDRSEYLYLKEDDTNKVYGFHTTARYCMHKPNLHKRAYLKV